mgnify:CR=1 FL=1
MKLTVKELVALALLTALLFVAQVALAFLPNIELVSLLIIVYTLAFRHKVLYVIYAFAVLEGLLYGFTMWWITYLYVWTVLAALAWAFAGLAPARRSPGRLAAWAFGAAASL